MTYSLRYRTGGIIVNNVEDLTGAFDVYALNGKDVRIPATTATEDIAATIYAAAGLTQQEAEDNTQTLADINPAQVTTALNAIVTMIGAINTAQTANGSDITALNAATTVGQMKPIFVNVVARETDMLQRQEDMLVLLRKLIKFCALLLPPTP